MLTLFCGCNIYKLSKPEPDHYYLNPDKSLIDIGRVAMINLTNNSGYPHVSSDVTDALFQAIQKKQIFSMTIVRPNDPEWRSLQLDTNATYTLEHLAEIRETLKCDAILIGAVEGYKPYPHLAIGLQLRLVDLDDGQIFWALEQIWDSADKTTEARIGKYFKAQMRPDSATLRQELISVSPLKFIKFAAYETAETIAPPKKKKAEYHFVLDDAGL